MSISFNDMNVWKRITTHHSALQLALMEFLSSNLDRVQIIQSALHNGEIAPVLYVAQFMSESEKKQLFAQWVDLASQAHRYIAQVRKIIHSLPQEWVIANIEAIAEPILQHGTEDEYRRMLEIYRELDGALTRRLATRATQHQDSEIREAGFDFLEPSQMN